MSDVSRYSPNGTPLTDYEYELFERWHRPQGSLRSLHRDEMRMTRDEALKIVSKGEMGPYIVDSLAALGVIQLDPAPTAKVLAALEVNGDIINRFFEEGPNLLHKYGAIRLELWPEGLMLWVGGEIVWKSWAP